MGEPDIPGCEGLEFTVDQEFLDPRSPWWREAVLESKDPTPLGPNFVLGEDGTWKVVQPPANPLERRQ
jgi:hypothetical protein